MEKKIMTVLTPDFYKDFHCVAADCRASCCVHPWAIFINKKNYKLLRGLREPKWLTDSFGSYIKRNPNSKSASDYACAVYNERGCAMQTENGLCHLQADLGAEYLCTTCQIYPRTDCYVTVMRSGEVSMGREKCLTISCEEVARMLLHKSEPIQLEYSEAEYNADSIANEHLPANNMIADTGTRPILAHYNLIRAVSIAILQNRDYAIEKRLMLLVLYLDKLAQAERDSTEDSIPAMTDTFIAAVDERLYDQLFTATPIPEVTAALTNFASLFAFSAGADTAIVKQCNESIGSVNYDVRMESYHNFMRDREHLLEHMLVTEFFGKALPFKSNRSIEDCIQYLVSIFTIFRFMLAAYLGERTTLPETDFIDFVAYFGKTVLHSTDSFDRNIDMLKTNGMNTLPYMMAIILG